MTDQLINKYKSQIESLTLIPSDGGKFELSVDNILVYSKLSTGEFPEWDEIENKIDAIV